MSIVNLSSMPDPPKEYTIHFPRLDGGLNTWELDYRLGANESPQMKNLWWKDGALCCRDGQTRLTDGADLGRGWSAYERPFWGNGFFHIGAALYRADLSVYPVEMVQVLSGVSENRGTWFEYGDYLYYKNRGGYYRIGYDPERGFSAENTPVFSPVIQINTEPTTAAGDTYQPENRICDQKVVWYSTVSGVKEYHLPVQGVESVDKVVVDGEELVEGTGYTVDLAAGTVTFTEAPTHHEPVQVNTVKITYTKTNAGAMSSIMDCPYDEEREEETMPRYNTVAECPEWARETVQKLVDRRILNGTGQGLDLSYDMVRLLVLLDRAGALSA